MVPDSVSSLLLNFVESLKLQLSLSTGLSDCDHDKIISFVVDSSMCVCVDPILSACLLPHYLNQRSVCLTTSYFLSY